MANSCDVLREALPEEGPIVLETRTREWAQDNAVERVLLRQAVMRDAKPLLADVLDRAVEQSLQLTPEPSGCVYLGDVTIFGGRWRCNSAWSASRPR